MMYAQQPEDQEQNARAASTAPPARRPARGGRAPSTLPFLPPTYSAHVQRPVVTFFLIDPDCGARVRFRYHVPGRGRYRRTLAANVMAATFDALAAGRFPPHFRRPTELGGHHFLALWLPELLGAGPILQADAANAVDTPPSESGQFSEPSEPRQGGGPDLAGRAVLGNVGANASAASGAARIGRAHSTKAPDEQGPSVPNQSGTDMPCHKEHRLNGRSPEHGFVEDGGGANPSAQSGNDTFLPSGSKSDRQGNCRCEGHQRAFAGRHVFEVHACEKRLCCSACRRSQQVGLM